ncbi:MarR family transcriptional regulator [Salmonella enterica]|uniref:MarR family transcriptional regulator n=1 Tax=Salmonella enterica subsp. salamae serovar 55:k:z39 str. 1315K TaxID=1243602 RepID=A0A6C7C1E8_SALER|nr:MarR family transcriptional regulator [Salmonella enterica]ECC1480858.1 MarR family transcriptional regulator [Salmonella enterica subsp. salamae]ASG86358.1 MarR family transcriptional regulator [Salmonella enterica subsp. salamae serovar 55:k:z39 str. 1315K]ECC1654408.1 MarR family transcriptional regulator [Salmonella enterica subsp. salamae]ECC1692605.1 MarR family transcriptional regulator [Salmonella enterica subsp. salamae]ECD9412855.1 MarR family transcriptional regulator [Salmonella
MITETELNILKFMAEKGIDWNWMVQDRTLARRNTPGFSNVANIVINLVNHGLVGVVYGEDISRPRYIFSQNSFDF